MDNHQFTAEKAQEYLPVLIRCVATILIGVSGIAAEMAWMPTPTGEAEIAYGADKYPAQTVNPVGTEARTALVRAEGEVRRKARVECEECGVVVSRQKIQRLDAGADSGATDRVTGYDQSTISGQAALSYEVTLRMKDGSSRAFMDAHPANWRPGERVIFIEGANRTND